MIGWLLFLLAWVAFLGAHVVPMMLPVRTRLIGVLGKRAYFTGYGIVSAFLLWVLIRSASWPPQLVLVPQAAWMRWLVNLVMPVVIVLAAYGLAMPNPFGLGRGGAGFDPERPGIVGLTRHPMMWAFALWAGAHLIANLDLAHLILFGVMLAFAFVGMDRAEARARADGRLQELGAHTGFWPFEALIAGRWRPQALPPLRPFLWAMVAWAVIYLLHPAVIGVSPHP